MSHSPTTGTAVDMAVEAGPLKLKNPLMTASGTFGYGSEYDNLYDPSVLGGIFLKALTMAPRPGNRPWRIYETPSGMLNSIGLQNVGIDEYFEKKEPFCRELAAKGTAICANLAAQTVGEFQQLVERLEETPTIAAYELNVSCPNVKKGGCQFGTDEALLRELVSSVRPGTKRPLIVKLAPQVTDIVRMAQVSVDAGADIVSLVNTFPAMAIDAEKRQPILATVTGGLSGPAIKPIALRMVHAVRQAVGVPLIGMGGIMTWKDAVEFMLAGASAIAVGTANFVHPTAALEILEGMEDYCHRHGFARVADLTGALQLP